MLGYRFEPTISQFSTFVCDGISQLNSLKLKYWNQWACVICVNQYYTYIQYNFIRLNSIFGPLTI